MIESKIDTGAVTTGKIGTGAVSYSRIQNVSATSRVLGRVTAGAGVIEEIPIGTAANDLVRLDGSARLPAVDGSQLTNLPSSAPTTAQVLNATAGANIYNVGTYIFAGQTTTGPGTEGFTIAGTNLRSASVASGSASGYTLSGTWRCMGFSTGSSGIGTTTLWLRIA